MFRPIYRQEPVNKNSQFHFTNGGIYLVFQEYEVSYYAAGNR
ncbi:DUF3298 domain-containing protein [Peribacillus glennii]|uniref:DUF3298 domain-containing protein n=1 Tax=Peribacillus glennii TaxID=2303991 RepID=A0A372L7R9_9BACI|nr:DUF3298 domain-containing protein [Peribacillus glennii]